MICRRSDLKDKLYNLLLTSTDGKRWLLDIGLVLEWRFSELLERLPCIARRAY
jgi:hypothetical protein